jgi:hypothetical protein
MTVIAAPKPAEAASPTHGGIGHNMPPLDVLIVDLFDEALDAKDGLRARIAQILERGADPKPCDSDDLAGRYGDFIKMVANVEAIVDGARTTIKAPYLEATRALDGKARGITDAVAAAKKNVKARLDAYVREQAEKVAAERRRIEAEQARLRAEAEFKAEQDRCRLQALENGRAAAEQRAAAVVEAPEPIVYAAPAPIAPEVPVFRGDLGSRVGVKTVWRHKIASVRKLPDALLKHPTVFEALDKVVAAQVRGGLRTITGVTIWDEQTSSVR